MKITKQNILNFLNTIYIKLRPVLVLAAVGLTLFCGYKMYKYFFGYHIVAEFTELGPMRQSMLVYYKGFKVGRTGKINPSGDFSSSNVRLILDRNLNHLPDNIIAKVKKFEQTGDEKEPQSYIEIISPSIPSKKFIRRGSVIEGKTAMDMASFMSSQADSGSLTIISTNMGKTLESVEKTSDELQGLLSDIRGILKQNKESLGEIAQNLSTTTKGLSATSKNLEGISGKINNSLREESITDIVQNLDSTSKSLDAAMKNVESITGNVDKATKNLDKTMEEFDSALGNIEDVTGGFKNTFSKRFGTMRFMFGTPIHEP